MNMELKREEKHNLNFKQINGLDDVVPSLKSFGTYPWMMIASNFIMMTS